jgi:gelsolin
MQKMETTKLEDSNMAGYGGKAHKDAKLAAAQSAEEWKGCGARPGIEIWRIEKFKVVKWPKSKYGKFFSGDSYIVLRTYKDPDSDALKYDVHFWLGEFTSQDEMGTAAYKTVELDDLLGDLPVQHREVQGFEGSKFLALFPNLTYMNGGVDSGFNHVEPEKYTPRLMHFKGKKKIRVCEVKLACESLNQGDVFLLDMGLTLIQWNGPTSGAMERRKAGTVIQDLKETRAKATSRVLDGDEDDDIFWPTLGGKGPIAPETPDIGVVPFTAVLLNVSDSKGSLTTTEVGRGPAKFSRSLLRSDDVSILDTGIVVYVYIGRGASHGEKRECMKIASAYMTSNNRPMTTPVVRILQGGETSAFNSYFA